MPFSNFDRLTVDSIAERSNLAEALPGPVPPVKGDGGVDPALAQPQVRDDLIRAIPFRLLPEKVSPSAFLAAAFDLTAPSTDPERLQALSFTTPSGPGSQYSPGKTTDFGQVLRAKGFPLKPLFARS